MTIKRPKRPPRPAARGRHKKLTTPPQSIGNPMISLELFQPADLQRLADTLDFEILEEGLLEPVCIAINQAFGEYANATSIQVSNSPASERRDWCAGVGRAAAELHIALGHTDQSLSFAKPAFAAEETLRAGWPANPQTPEQPRCARR